MKKLQTRIPAVKQLTSGDLKKIMGGKASGGKCEPGYSICSVSLPCCAVACCSGGPDEFVAYCLQPGSC